MAADENVDHPQHLIPGVESAHSRAASFVNFKNCTNSEVDVIWLGYHGEPVVYGTLPPAGHLKLKTYETHPWVFRNKRTLEKLQINYQDIFHPIPFSNTDANSHHPVYGPVSPRFITQSIHYPLYNLKERASQVVLRNLSDPLHAFELDIPTTLKYYVAETKFRH